jgi:hypothetical protein
VISNFTIRNGGPAAGTQGAGGGGIFVSNAAPTIQNNIITANINHCIEVAFGAALIQNNTLSGTLGTGASFFDGTGVILTGVSQIPGLPYSALIGNTIENNLHAHEYDGGGIGLWAVEGTIILDNIIRNNATTGIGGGIVAYNSDRMYIINNLIYGNTAASTALASSGGMSIIPPNQSVGPFIGVIAGNTIAGNSITAAAPANNGETGEQISIEGNLAQYVLVNNIIVGASSTLPAVTCGLTYQALATTPLVFDHNDIFNSKGPLYGGACPNQTGTYGNISADPTFSNPGSGDYTLRSGSPAIDAGNNGAPLMTVNDIAGSPRIQDATGKGYPIIDMGAYEFAGRQDAPPTVLTLRPSEYFPNSNPQPLTFTANLASSAGTPTGPVTIYVDGAVVTTVLVDNTGSVTFSLPGLTPGLHAFTASYNGSGSFPPATSVKFYLDIPVVATTLTIQSAPNPSTFGTSVLFTVTASAKDNTIPSPITLTDTTTNTVLATLTPNSAGVATYSTSTLSVGTHNIQASYTATASYSASSASVVQTVNAGASTSVALTSSLNPAPFGQSVNFTATVSVPAGGGVPTGSITFSEGTTTLATQPLAAAGTSSATAAFSIGTLAVGSHTIVATYVPSGGFSGGSATLTETISGLATSTALTATPNPALVGQAVTMTASVTASSGTPSGTLTFYDGTTAIGTSPLDSFGRAVLTTSTLAAGAHTLTAAYAGASGYAASTSAPFVETIQAQALTGDFTITLASPTITIRTQHHTTTTVTLASLNGFADSLAITCSKLPQYLTCRPTPNPATLAANGTTAVSLYLDTDAVLGYARNTAPTTPSRHPSPISWALLFAPLSLFAGARYQRKAKPALRLLVALLAILPLSLALAGCGEIIIPADIPPSVAPGTYVIPITATGATTGVSHTAQLTLQVTP